MENGIKRQGFELTSFDLRIIAIAAMFIDHAAAVLPHIFVGDCYIIMRMIGRLAFPIFCFLITEGFSHTKNISKYVLRLALFAVISEIPFDLAFSRTVFDTGHQNVFFTLLLGLAGICAAGKGAKALIGYFCKKLGKDESISKSPILQSVVALPVIALCAYLAEVLACDYGAQGVLMICALYMFRERKAMAYIALILINSALCMSVSVIPSSTSGILEMWNVVFYDSVQWAAPLAVIPIMLYKGKAGRKSMKYFFYAFYPLHIFVLYLISLF